MVTIGKLATSTEQMTGMMRRIRNNRHRLMEKEAFQLLQAFAISRIVYGTAYLRLTKTELEKLNVVVKKAFKSALGVSGRTPTERLTELGVHNTFEELREAQIAAQLERLDGTANGRWLLGKLNLEAEGSRALPSDYIPREIRAKIKVSRIPRNMLPEGDAERRRARSEALGRTWDRRSGTVYVDAARGQDGIATVALVSSDGEKTISVA